MEALSGALVVAPLSAIDRHPFRAFAILTLIYFVVDCSLSSLKLLWLDELITLHIARLSSPAAIWQALEWGVDPNPPLSHLLVHYSRLMFGEHEVVLRLPAMVGYWAGMLALFLYLKRRITPTWAMVGTIGLMTMGAFEYSYESRSYGIIFGLAMVAFYFWSRAASLPNKGSSRSGAIAGMALALAAGISANYFAIVAFFPVAIGELVRTLIRGAQIGHYRKGRVLRVNLILRAIDYPIWTAIILAVTPLLAYRSMIEHSIAQFAPYAWNKVSLGKVADSYTEMIEIHSLSNPRTFRSHRNHLPAAAGCCSPLRQLQVQGGATRHRARFDGVFTWSEDPLARNSGHWWFHGVSASRVYHRDCSRWHVLPAIRHSRLLWFRNYSNIDCISSVW